MDKKVPVSQCDVVTPPPPTKATLSSFPLQKLITHQVHHVLQVQEDSESGPTTTPTNLEIFST
ncbi:hypothetical protein AHAS_Ahas03G0151600 [Arachis hypogaea]